MKEEIGKPKFEYKSFAVDHDLYEELERNYFLERISSLEEDTTIYDIFLLVDSNYNYLIELLKNKDIDISEINKLRLFVYNPYNYILNNDFPKSTRCLIEKPNFLPDLTGYENLKLLASIENKIGDKEIMDTIEKLNLKEEINKKYGKYSLGTKQKLGIAQVLMEDPKLIVLDEPLNGIENETAKEVRKILNEEKKKEENAKTKTTVAKTGKRKVSKTWEAMQRLKGSLIVNDPKFLL